MNHEIQTINAGHQLSVAAMQSHVAIIEEMTRSVMKKGMHYGVIPGCGDKPTLLQPGAQKLALAFQLTVEPECEWNDLPNGHREYHCKCHLIDRATGKRVGTGLGNCSTMESRYRFRTEYTEQPVPKDYWKTRDPNVLGGPQFSPKKVNGEWQIIEKIEHSNPADYFNTCEKIAKKRAMIDGILTCTAASDHFTQDIEDAPELFGAQTGASVQGESSGQSKPTSGNGAGKSAPADNDPIVQFGKHKGKKFSAVPLDYLQWCVDNAQKDSIKDLARKEIERRPMDQSAPAADAGQPAGKSSGPAKMATEEDIRTIHKQLDAAEITMKEMLEMFQLNSSEQIRASDVPIILAWLNDPGQTPPKLPAF